MTGNKKVNKVSAETGTTPYITQIKVRDLEFTSDEPVEDGGANKGPRPHELLLSALAACTCITVRMYANRKGWDLVNVRSDAELTRVTESGEQTASAVQWMTFEGNLDDEQIERLMVIAGKCPVHKTLSRSMNIEIKLKTDG
jgi:putative redox protein